MASYSEVFKRDALKLLIELRDKGFIKVDEHRKIKDVRDLCSYLDISSWSLYDWEKKFPLRKTEINDDSDEVIPLRVICIKESWCKAYQPKNDEINPNCNMLGNCDDFVEFDGVDIHESESEYKMTSKEIDGVVSECIVTKNGKEFDDFDDINYELETRIAEKAKNLMNLEPKVSTFCKPVIAIKKTKSNISSKFNFSIELNLIKSLYANRFGSTTNKTKAHMLRALTNAWSEK